MDLELLLYAASRMIALSKVAVIDGNLLICSCYQQISSVPYVRVEFQRVKNPGMLKVDPELGMGI